MKLDFTKPAPSPATLKEANEIISFLWSYCAKNKNLESEVKELKEQLNTNSQNSSLPSSKDKPSSKKKPKKKKRSTRKQGAQPGHSAHKRELVPVEEVDHVEECNPTKQCSCGGLVIKSKNHRKHQYFELPVIKPIVTEYQMFSGKCCVCEKTYWGTLPANVSTGMLGPRAIAMVATLTGSYRVSKRNVVNLFEDIYRFKISVGSVSKAEKIASMALKGPVEEAKTFIKTVDNIEVHADETGHKEKGKRMWAWVAVALLVSVFIIRASRGSKVAKELLGENFKGILNSDRWSAYTWVKTRIRQLCWAHLKRDFKKISERSGTSGIIGDELLLQTNRMFSYWDKVKSGQKTKADFQRYMKCIRKNVEGLLIRGTRCKNKKTSGTCKHILNLKEALWTFVDRDGIDPTNNTAEQVIRTHVIWTKTSFGTQSPAGTEYMERVLTAVGSCKLQKRNVLDFMTDAVQSYFSSSKQPSLIPEANVGSNIEFRKAA